MSTGTKARDRIFALVDAYIADARSAHGDSAAARAALPQDVLADLDGILADSRISYRDGIMIQLAYGLEDGSLDLTRRGTGARTVARELGAFLGQRHIRSVKDAYQNIAKNTEVLTRGNVAQFDRLLTWANGAGPDYRAHALHLACATVAATARPVLPMPQLNRSALTFARAAGVLLDLVATPSGGAYEQFAVAALLDTVVRNHAADRVRVETKSLNASDRSSFAAGDVQIATGSRVIEAFEVTANPWRRKLADAPKTISDNDLSRLHIIAQRAEAERGAVRQALMALPVDLTVLDVRQVLEVLTALLTRPQRAEALARLHEYLDRYQPDTERVNTYVRLLGAAGLVEGAGD